MTFRDDALAGQHIVISGGAGAIGVGIVRKLVEHGAQVTVNDIVAPDEARQRLQTAGVKLESTHYVQADLTLEADVRRLIAAAREKFGPVHNALCHVGTVFPGPLLDITLAEWEKTQSVNVTTAFLLGQAAAKAMIEDHIQGQLIFTSSWVAQVPWPEIGPYNASKAAMNQLMRSFARELATEGIRANAIAPGIVGVGLAKWQWDTDPTYRARAQKAIPLGDMQLLDSVADAFLFMCSPASRYMTGSILTVDGGCSLYPMD
ncbi:MAG: SDR family oxidoreductase [Anaerolineaceae bacterium]|nr:SDR family oxidoreductase [Anaerolineaceae bacterium]